MTAVRSLFNTQVYIRVLINKCSNISNFNVDLGDNDIRNFSVAIPYINYYLPKSYSKTSLFTINWTMIGVASIQSQINCIKLRIVYFLL